MSRKTQLLMLVPSALIGLGLPVAVLFAIVSGMDALLGTIVIVISLLVAGALGVVGLGVTTALPGTGGGEDETARTLRASQRAMIEEMDELVDLLSQIRDTLRSTGDDGN